MAKKTSKKLPKNIATMVEKNNFVIAIKTLVAEENISFDEAKERIDAYEEQLKQKQQQKQENIVKNQTPTITTPPSSFDTLQNDLDKKLISAGYKKPLLPYWVKRVVVIVIVLMVVLWAFWQFIK